MVVERDTGQGRDIDLVLHGVGYLCRQQGVQGMDALDDQYTIASKV